MGEFSRDLGEAFRAANGICEFLLERHPASRLLKNRPS